MLLELPLLYLFLGLLLSRLHQFKRLHQSAANERSEEHGAPIVDGLEHHGLQQVGDEEPNDGVGAGEGDGEGAGVGRDTVAASPLAKEGMGMA